MGCRKEDEPGAMIRLVLGESGELLVDLGARAFGRGGWVHPRSDCLLRTVRGGAARSFKARVATDAPTVFAALRAAADQRVLALLGAARGARHLVSGTDSVQAAFEKGEATLILLATDARATASTGFLARAAARGLVRLWGTKERIGQALARPDTAVVAVTEHGFADAIDRAIALNSLPEPDARHAGHERAVVEVR